MRLLVLTRSILFGNDYLDHVNQEAKLIKYTEFYNESLNGFIDFMDDFKRFREKVFALCNFPFVLTVTTKANILKLESSVLMREKLQVRKLKVSKVISHDDGN